MFLITLKSKVYNGHAAKDMALNGVFLLFDIIIR